MIAPQFEHLLGRANWYLPRWFERALPTLDPHGSSPGAGNGHPDAGRRHRMDPAREEHWHGGTADNVLCHIAMLEGTAQDDGTTWLEPVSDEEYQAANTSGRPSA